MDVLIWTIGVLGIALTIAVWWTRAEREGDDG